MRYEKPSNKSGWLMSFVHEPNLVSEWLLSEEILQNHVDMKAGDYRPWDLHISWGPAWLPQTVDCHQLPQHAVTACVTVHGGSLWNVGGGVLLVAGIRDQWPLEYYSELSQSIHSFGGGWRLNPYHFRPHLTLRRWKNLPRRIPILSDMEVSLNGTEWIDDAGGYRLPSTGQ